MGFPRLIFMDSWQTRHKPIGMLSERYTLVESEYSRRKEHATFIGKRI
jgi:hypothetical protein